MNNVEQSSEETETKPPLPPKFLPFNPEEDSLDSFLSLVDWGYNNMAGGSRLGTFLYVGAAAIRDFQCSPFV